MDIVKSGKVTHIIKWVPPYSNDIINKDRVRSFCKLLDSEINLVNSSQNLYETEEFECKFDFSNFDLTLKDYLKGKIYKTTQNEIDYVELTFNFNVLTDGRSESIVFTHCDIKIIFKTNNYEMEEDFKIIKEKLCVTNTFVKGTGTIEERIHNASFEILQHYIWR